MFVNLLYIITVIAVTNQKQLSQLENTFLGSWLAGTCSVISAPWRLRPAGLNSQFKANLNYMARLCLEQRKKEIPRVYLRVMTTGVLILHINHHSNQK